MNDMKPLKIQPIPYQGSKRVLAPRICQLFPENVATLYEPFAGSAAMSIYAAYRGLADHFVIGDVYPALMKLWQLIIDEPDTLIAGYRSLWGQQFSVGLDHFNDVRARYNERNDPIALLYLVARCVKNAVRFNAKGHFTQSVDKRRTGVNPDRLAIAVLEVSRLLKGRVTLFTGDFEDCIAAAGGDDLVYMDPPYQGVAASADKRYAAQLPRDRLLGALSDLNARNVPFILSYDGRTGSKTYGDPLPDSIGADHIEIHAGRSSQATLNGHSHETVESIYVSRTLGAVGIDVSLARPLQSALFL